MQFESEHVYEPFLFLLLIIDLFLSVFLLFGHILLLNLNGIFGGNWLRVLAVLVVFTVLVRVIVVLIVPVVFAVAPIGVAVAETPLSLSFEAVLMVRLLLILLYWALLSILLVRRGRLLAVAVLVGLA